MSTKRTKSKIDWLVGKWRYNAAVSPVLFTIERTTGGFRIHALDESDAEKLVVSKIKLDRDVLTFETLTPSNKWRTRNRLKAISKTKAIHELTFWEPWEKVPSEAPTAMTKKQSKRAAVSNARTK